LGTDLPLTKEKSNRRKCAGAPCLCTFAFDLGNDINHCSQATQTVESGVGNHSFISVGNQNLLLVICHFASRRSYPAPMVFKICRIMQRLCLDGYVTKPWMEGGSSRLRPYSSRVGTIRWTFPVTGTGHDKFKIWLPARRTTRCCFGDEACYAPSPARPHRNGERLGNDYGRRQFQRKSNVESFVVDMLASVLDEQRY
jgi:hypothetical protein